MSPSLLLLLVHQKRGPKRRRKRSDALGRRGLEAWQETWRRDRCPNNASCGGAESWNVEPRLLSWLQQARQLRRQQLEKMSWTMEVLLQRQGLVAGGAWIEPKAWGKQG